MERNKVINLAHMCMDITDRLCSDQNKELDGEFWVDLYYTYSKGKLTIIRTKLCDGPEKISVRWGTESVLYYDMDPDPELAPVGPLETILTYVPGIWEQKIQRLYNAIQKRGITKFINYVEQL